MQLESIMIGLIPNCLEMAVEQLADSESVKEVRRRAGVPLDHKFTYNGCCPEEDWLKLVVAACDVLDLKPDELEKKFADFFYHDAIERWPRWFEMASNSKEFIERQPAIHNTFGISTHCSQRDVNEKFSVETNGNKLVTYYRSPNRHCGLYQELARLIIDHYGDRATIEEPRCMKRGDDVCEIHIYWDENQN